MNIKKPQSLVHHRTTVGFHLSILLNARRPQNQAFLKMQHVVLDKRIHNRYLLFLQKISYILRCFLLLREQKGLEILDIDNLKEFTTLCDELPTDFKSQYILEDATSCDAFLQ
jgi:hypothetical protein